MPDFISLLQPNRQSSRVNAQLELKESVMAEQLDPRVQYQVKYQDHQSCIVISRLFNGQYTLKGASSSLQGTLASSVDVGDIMQCVDQWARYK